MAGQASWMEQLLWFAVIAVSMLFGAWLYRRRSGSRTRPAASRRSRGSRPRKKR